MIDITYWKDLVSGDMCDISSAAVDCERSRGSGRTTFGGITIGVVSFRDELETHQNSKLHIQRATIRRDDAGLAIVTAKEQPWGALTQVCCLDHFHLVWKFVVLVLHAVGAKVSTKTEEC